MIKALENASLVSGDGITPVLVSSRPVSPAEMKITVENLVSRDLAGTLNGHGITVKGSSSGSLSLPLPITLKDTEITHQQIPVEFKTGQSQFKADSSFDGFCCRKVKDGLTLSEIDWAKLPAVTFTKYTGKQKETDGSFRMAWNTQGLFGSSCMKNIPAWRNAGTTTACRFTSTHSPMHAPSRNRAMMKTITNTESSRITREPPPAYIAPIL